MKSFNESIEVLKKYNKEPFHIEHGITVGLVLGWFAKNAGMSDEEVEYWKTVGLLHDIDFEMYPEEHCKKCVELLKNEGYDDEFIKSVCSHGFGPCSDVEPTKEMEKVLFTVDELTGIIFAAAKMRPSKSCTDMELSSLKKKFKDKRFAAGCDREVIKLGAEKYMQMDLDEVLNKTLEAMKENETGIRELLSAHIKSV